MCTRCVILTHPQGLGDLAVLEEFPSATILRPSMIIGAEDKCLSRIAEWKKHLCMRVPLVDGGVATKQLVYVGDVAKAIVNAINLPGGATNCPSFIALATSVF